MATESLVIELDARTKKLDAALKKTTSRLDKLDDKAEKSGATLGKMTNVATGVATALTKTAVAGLALATALTAVVLKSAANQQELALLSSQTKQTTDDFEALSFATKQYGINAEQIADISKDISDKLGEFGKAGTGAFQDYADVVGLTKEEAKAAAIEFENMSSDKVLGKMVSELEKAGASGNEVTFVLESMGNDLSRLIPLFANNSKELAKLTSVYSKATSQLKLTKKEINGLKGAATSFDLLTDSLSKSGDLISAQIAPILTEFFGGVIDIAPKATQSIVDFINSFKDPKDITNLQSIESQLIETQKELAEASRDLAVASNAATRTGSNGELIVREQLFAKQKDTVKELNEKLAKLLAQQKLLKEQQVEPSAIAGVGADAGGGIGVDSGTGDEIQAIADRFKTEQQLLDDKLAIELQAIGANDELKLQLLSEYQDNTYALKQAGFAADMALEEEAEARADEIFNNELERLDELARAEKNAARLKKKADSDKLQSASYYTSAAASINSAFFEDNKAIGAGVIIADTAIAIGKANALGYPLAIPAMAAAAAAGAAQLAALKGAAKGGGSISAPSAPPITPIEAIQPTTQLAISDTDESGAGQSQVITLKIESDDSATAEFVNGILNQGRIDGVIQ